MLTISREAQVKVGKHAWNVYPLEAFGFLLGRNSEQTVYAALPCSKTRRWHEFDDRWNGIDVNATKAAAVARLFDMEVVGLYASTEESFSRAEYPMPAFGINTSMDLVMLYRTMCCPGHSWATYKAGTRWLTRDETYVVPRGKRADNAINQKKILKAWYRFAGPVDYSNRQAPDRSGDGAYIASDRVLHPKFGKGTVIGRTIVPGTGRVDRVQVLFDSGDSKFLALEYARLTLLDPKDFPDHFLGLQKEPEPVCTPEEATLEMLEQAISNWEKSVEYFSVGFDCSEEYTHDLMSRETLHGVLNGLAAIGITPPDSVKSRIDAADRRFIELTCEIENHVWGTPHIYGRNTFWYYYRWPKK